MKNAISKIICGLFILTTFHMQSQQNVISTKEINYLKYMVEEEKVARDVYEGLDEIWALRVFGNIKQSEQTHIDMIENLLKINKITYKLNNEKGVFNNKSLQKMHYELLEKGTKSKQEALEVGKLIEEKDIKDLEDAIKNTQNPFIKQVYSNLLSASQNHLRAFNRQLARF